MTQVRNRTRFCHPAFDLLVVPANDLENWTAIFGSSSFDTVVNHWKWFLPAWLTILAFPFIGIASNRCVDRKQRTVKEQWVDACTPCAFLCNWSNIVSETLVTSYNLLILINSSCIGLASLVELSYLASFHLSRYVRTFEAYCVLFLVREAVSSTECWTRKNEGYIKNIMKLQSSQLWNST